MYATKDYFVPPALASAPTGRTDAGDDATHGEPSTPITVPAPRKPVDDATWPLTHCPKAAGAARAITAVMLNQWHIGEEEAETVILVVSELVTNAVQHARPPVLLHLHREHSTSRVWVGVTDGGPAAHQGAWSTSCTDDESGRGLSIIDAVSSTHGAHSAPGGTTHWARLHATRPDTM
jgi:anti-sigma regulatory factor (Ser/Thr protein kinase)